MNWKQIGLGIVLLGFSLLTAECVYQYGYLGFFRMAASNIVSITLSADVVIALTMIAVYMGNDARERGISPVPYLLLTLTLGSVGPLLYLIRRSSDASANVPRAAQVSNA
jgi:hypothetical protein